ncbi:MAG: helix-turn-helix domain-containing protein [Candidatus Methylomirabilales bacterium]
MNTVMEKEEKRTVGQLLRAAREAKGISREEAAAATRIKSVFLGAMEEDDYNLLPDERYLLRFLGEYASFLELDPQDVQRRFSQQIHRSSSSLAVFPGKRTVTLSLRRVLLGLVLLAFFIPSLFIVLSLLTEQPQKTRGPEPPEESQAVRVAPPMETPVSTPETVTTSPITTAAPALPDRPVPSDVPGEGHTLRVEAAEMTWMLVTIDDGETQDVLLQAGESWVWHAQQGFVVTVGNAGGVALALDDRPLPQLGESGQVIRNLRLPDQSSLPPESP